MKCKRCGTETDMPFHTCSKSMKKPKSDTPKTDEFFDGELDKCPAAEFCRGLERENTTFRAAQKSCEDCDGPTFREVIGLREENKRLLAMLSSGLCSHHQTPDPLNCDTCNKVKVLEGANADRQDTIYELRNDVDRLQHSLDKIRESEMP